MAIGVRCLISNPSDLPHFDDGRAWRDLSDCLEPSINRGELLVERSVSASEAELRQAATHQASVLHFIGHAKVRAAAAYPTLALVAADGRARNLTAPAFANIVARSSFRVVVLEACEETSFCFDMLAASLAERDLTVILIPCLEGPQRRNLLARLYAGLIEDVSPVALSELLAAASDGRARVVSGGLGPLPIAEPDPEPLPAPKTPAPQVEVAAGRFDVFVCYNSADRPAVKLICERLKAAGIAPWLDVWELPPGRDWHILVEEQIARVRSAAVFVGASGRGPWQAREVRGLLQQFVESDAHIIPVVLADAPIQPDLPLFLKSVVWVDFRRQDPDPFIQLVWGITGERPAGA